MPNQIKPPYFKKQMTRCFKLSFIHYSVVHPKILQYYLFGQPIWVLCPITITFFRLIPSDFVTWDNLIFLCVQYIYYCELLQARPSTSSYYRLRCVQPLSSGLPQRYQRYYQDIVKFEFVVNSSVVSMDSFFISDQIP